MVLKQSRNKGSILHVSSIPRNANRTTLPKPDKEARKLSESGINVPETSPQAQVSRRRSQPTVPGASQSKATQNVLPPPLHLHNLRPLNPLPQTHNRMPARLDRTRPTPLNRLQTHHTPLPKLETRETVPAMPEPKGSADEPDRSGARSTIRCVEVESLVLVASAWERFLESKGG